MLKRSPKIVYFIEGPVPTIDDLEAAEALGTSVVFLNACLVPKTGNVKKYAAVAGAVPEAYKDFPKAEEMLKARKEAIAKERKEAKAQAEKAAKAKTVAKKEVDKAKAEAAEKAAEAKAKTAEAKAAKAKATKAVKAAGKAGTWKPNA